MKLATHVRRCPWREMPKSNGNEPTQETRPERGPPAEIPIPTREQILRDLEKLAAPRRKPPPEDED